MKNLFNLASIESALLRRLVLVVHVPLIVAVLLLHVVEGALNGARNFVVGVFHSVVNFAIGVVAGVSMTVQDFVQHIVIGVQQIGADVRRVWSGAVLPVTTASATPSV